MKEGETKRRSKAKKSSNIVTTSGNKPFTRSQNSGTDAKRKIGEVTSPESPEWKIRPVDSPLPVLKPRRLNELSGPETLKPKRLNELSESEVDLFTDSRGANALLDDTELQTTLTGYSLEEITRASASSKIRTKLLDSKIEKILSSQNPGDLTDSSEEDTSSEIESVPSDSANTGPSSSPWDTVESDDSGDVTLKHLNNSQFIEPMMTSTPTPNSPRGNRIKDEVANFMTSDSFDTMLLKAVKGSLSEVVNQAVDSIAVRLGELEPLTNTNTEAINDINSKLDNLDIDKFTKQLEELDDKVTQKLGEFNDKINQVDTQSISKKIDAFAAKLDKVDTATISKKLSDFSESVTNINPASNIKILASMDYIEQQQRAKNLIFSGVPEKEEENLERVIVAIAKGLGVIITKNDISTAFRTGKATKKRPRIIIVKFESEKAKREIYRARINVKKLEAGSTKSNEDDADDPDNPIPTTSTGGATDGQKKKPAQYLFINEDLTQNRSKVYRAVRDIAVPRGWKCWTENGVIFLRNKREGPPIKLISNTEVEELNKQLKSNRQ
jgi:hypothetical protein